MVLKVASGENEKSWARHRGYVSQGVQIRRIGKSWITDRNMRSGVIPNLSLIASGIQDEALQQRLITDALSPILSAMEEEDGTLLADLITYELVELLDIL